MSQVLLIAHLIANLLGSNVEQDWACWESNPAYVPQERYAAACEYVDTLKTITIFETWEGATSLTISPNIP